MNLKILKQLIYMCENIKYKWNANFIDVYKTNITKLKTTLKRLYIKQK